MEIQGTKNRSFAVLITCHCKKQGLSKFQYIHLTRSKCEAEKYFYVGRQTFNQSNCCSFLFQIFNDSKKDRHLKRQITWENTYEKGYFKYK